MANLTLMALGSSAPEILLAIIEAASNLDGCPGELGPSTIVGSAAFNLLVISAVSIYAVSKESELKKDVEDRDKDFTEENGLIGLKKIERLSVFATTALFSLWAYAWMWIVLADMLVTIPEAILTFAFVFALLTAAYIMDRCNANDDEDEGESLKSAYTAVEIYKTFLEKKAK